MYNTPLHLCQHNRQMKHYTPFRKGINLYFIGAINFLKMIIYAWYERIVIVFCRYNKLNTSKVHNLYHDVVDHYWTNGSQVSTFVLSFIFSIPPSFIDCDITECEWSHDSLHFTTNNTGVTFGAGNCFPLVMLNTFIFVLHFCFVVPLWLLVWQ